MVRLRRAATTATQDPVAPRSWERSFAITNKHTGNLHPCDGTRYRHILDMSPNIRGRILYGRSGTPDNLLCRFFTPVRVLYVCSL